MVLVWPNRLGVKIRLGTCLYNYRMGETSRHGGTDVPLGTSRVQRRAISGRGTGDGRARWAIGSADFWITPPPCCGKVVPFVSSKTFKMMLPFTSVENLLSFVCAYNNARRALAPALRQIGYVVRFEPAGVKKLLDGWRRVPASLPNVRREASGNVLAPNRSVLKETLPAHEPSEAVRGHNPDCVRYPIRRLALPST